MADELYSLPRDQFTAARNAATKRAREQGNRELAEQISGLRRPSTAAWVANLLAREQPEEIRALVTLGDGLREAQRQLLGDELRRLSQQRHELVRSLVRQAQALARTTGHPVSESVSRELVNTFTAAVNSSTAAKALAKGRLTTALDPADAASELFTGAGLVAGGGPAQAREGSRRDPDDSAGPMSETERLHRDLERWRAEAADADTARVRAERALTSADQAAEAAVTALRELRERLEAAVQAEHETRRRARSAQRDFETADRTAREAHRRVHELQHRLTQHSSG